MVPSLTPLASADTSTTALLLFSTAILPGAAVYYIQDTDTTAATVYTVTLVGTINSAVELNAADFFAGTDSFA